MSVSRDAALARTLLNRQRSEKNTTRIMPRSGPFDAKEATAILESIASGHIQEATPGVVQILLDEYHADACMAELRSNKGLKKAFGFRNEARSNIVPQATMNCSAEVLAVLLQSVDNVAKNQALAVAMGMKNPHKITLLLTYGADAAPYCNEFRHAVYEKSIDVVEALLGFQSNGPCQQCLDFGLQAVIPQSLPSRVARLLVRNGANAGYKNAAVLFDAIHSGRSNVIDAVMSCVNKPSSGALDSAVERAVKTRRPDILHAVLKGQPSKEAVGKAVKIIYGLDTHNTTLEMAFDLVEAGVSKDDASEMLCWAVQNFTNSEHAQPTSEDTLYKLIRYLLQRGGADPSFQEARTLLLSITYGFYDLIALLTRYTFSGEALNIALKRAMGITHHQHRLKIVSILVDARVQGMTVAVGNALSQSAGLGIEELDLTAKLMSRTSVDFDGGRPLINAVRSGCIEQMELLIQRGKPNSQTVRLACGEVLITNKSAFHLSAFQLLFHNGATTTEANEALYRAAALGSQGCSICELMLEYGASPEHWGGRAVANAAKYRSLETLQVFYPHVKSPDIYSTAFEALVSRPDWHRPEGLQIANSLLKWGARGYQIDHAFVQAVAAREEDAVDFLFDYVSKEAINNAFVALTRDSNDWLAPENECLDMMSSLLERGDIEQQQINWAYLTAIEAYAGAQEPCGLAKALVDTLMTVGNGADVNFQDGEALKIAIRHRNLRLLTTLVNDANTTRKSITEAFPEAIITDCDAARTLQFIDVLTKNGKVRPDFAALPQEGKNLVQLCMEAHPNSAMLVQRLSKAGCDMEGQALVYSEEDNNNMNAETVTALIWALSQYDVGRIDSDTIAALLDTNVSITHRMPSTQTTALILATKHGRGDIVDKLLERNANPAEKDLFGNTALFYASLFGHLHCVRSLVAAKAPPNDGSLNEAAKHLYFEIVDILRKNGHSPSFPSSVADHGGRTALQSLALMSHTPGPLNSTALDQTIRLLIQDYKSGPGADIIGDTFHGRNALFLAMDNINPIPVCRALLDIALWNKINDPRNVLVLTTKSTGVKYYYSPTEFIRHGLCLAQEKYRRELLTLLKQKGFEDRFYAERGAQQPYNVVGMPEDIEKEENIRKAREKKLWHQEEEHKLALLRKKQQQEVTQEIEREFHNQQLLHQKEKAEMRRHQQKLDHIQQQIIRAQQSAAKLEDIRKLDELKQHTQWKAEEARVNAAREKARSAEENKRRLAQLDLNKLAEEQRLKEEYSHRMRTQRIEEQQRQECQRNRVAQEREQLQKRAQAMRQQDDRRKMKTKKAMDSQALRTQRIRNAEARRLMQEQSAREREKYRLQKGNA